jgi:hypothetical protein
MEQIELLHQMICKKKSEMNTLNAELVHLKAKYRLEMIMSMTQDQLFMDHMVFDEIVHIKAKYRLDMVLSMTQNQLFMDKMVFTMLQGEDLDIMTKKKLRRMIEKKLSLRTGSMDQRKKEVSEAVNTFCERTVKF